MYMCNKQFTSVLKHLSNLLFKALAGAGSNIHAGRGRLQAMPLNLPFEELRATGPVAPDPDGHFRSTQEPRLAPPRDELLMDRAVHCVSPMNAVRHLENMC